MVSLNEFWFILVAVLFIGFFFLEGFDFGVGMATRFLGRNDLERRVMINTIGPFWDANEVWLLTGEARFSPLFRTGMPRCSADITFRLSLFFLH